MTALDLKIPPPLVCLIIGSGMWGLAALGPVVPLPPAVRTVVALLLTLAGAGFQLAGFLAVRRAQTTINPMKPEATSALVATGIFAVSRNPMYVGFTLLLLAWAVWLAAPWTLLGPVAFVLYMNRFQIAPEERVLAAMFGADYAAYVQRVRRWV